MNSRRPNGTSAHPSRSFRCADDVWQAAQAQASANGVTLTSVLVEFLREYGESA